MKPFIRCLIILLGFTPFARGWDVDESVVAKIVVKSDGSLFFDDQKIEMRELERWLTPIQEKRGIVWFYGANLKGRPHPMSLEVLKVVTAMRIPIRLLPRTTFREPGGPKTRSQSQQG